jgi:hypothetical protein
MEYVDGLVLLALLMGGFIVSALAAGRGPKRLPAPPEPPPSSEDAGSRILASPRAPTWEDRMGAVGIRRLVDALESPDARRAVVTAKLACAERELADVERRRCELLAEQAGLRAELAMGEPYRGSPASLDDPPDDRAKAMPALKEEDGEGGVRYVPVRPHEII